MGRSAVKPAFGTLLKKGSTAIAEIVSIDGPEAERETLDVTHMESPNATREFIGSLVDAGEVSFEGNFLPGNATQKDLLAELYGGSEDTWTIVWSDAPGTNDWPFTAIVTKFKPSAALGEKLKFTATLKLTGMPTFPS